MDVAAHRSRSIASDISFDVPYALMGEVGVSSETRLTGGMP